MSKQNGADIRWLERATFVTNPALDTQRLRRIVAAARGPESGQPPNGRAKRPDRTNGVDSLHALTDLLTRLRRPARVANVLRVRYDDALNRSLARLVLDDVLRVRTRGGFLSGPRAYSRIFREPVNAVTSRRDVPRLSELVLEHVSRLPVDDAEELAVELYISHRRPVTPKWHRRYYTPAATFEQLTADADSSVRRLLETRWELLPSPRGTDDWLAWTTRAPSLGDGRAGVTYKLYLSPALHAVRDAFRRAIPVFADIGVEQFKIGSGAHALCRPDKFVAYFRSREALDESINALRRALGTMAAHGVPFCASADRRGLLWWGIDFHDRIDARRSRERTSWRMWLCQRLARYLVLARRDNALRISPTAFALERLRLDGVDPATFVPSSDFIRDAAFQPEPAHA